MVEVTDDDIKEGGVFYPEPLETLKVPPHLCLHRQNCNNVDLSTSPRTSDHSYIFQKRVQTTK